MRMPYEPVALAQWVFAVLLPQIQASTTQQDIVFVKKDKVAIKRG